MDVCYADIFISLWFGSLEGKVSMWFSHLVQSISSKETCVFCHDICTTTWSLALAVENEVATTDIFSKVSMDFIQVANMYRPLLFFRPQKLTWNRESPGDFRGCRTCFWFFFWGVSWQRDNDVFLEHVNEETLPKEILLTAAQYAYGPWNYIYIYARPEKKKQLLLLLLLLKIPKTTL